MLERERERCRHVKVNIASADRQVEREREFRQFIFTLGTRLLISKFCVDLCKKKSDRTRCLAVSIPEYNLGPKITGVRGTILTGIRSRQSERKRFDF